MYIINITFYKLYTVYIYIKFCKYYINVGINVLSVKFRIFISFCMKRLDDSEKEAEKRGRKSQWNISRNVPRNDEENPKPSV